MRCTLKSFRIGFGSVHAINPIPFRIPLKIRTLLLFVFFQMLVFFPALSNSSPWSDDWGYIYYASDSNRNIAHDAIAAGRPILGLVDQFAFQTDFIAENSVVLQLLSLSGLLLLQLSLYSKLKKNYFSDPLLTLAPLLLILIPGMQGYVYFLSCFPYSWACLLGFISFDFINSQARSRIVVGFLLIILAFLIYPAGAMFYFLSYFIDFTIRFKQERTFRDNIKNLLGICLKLLAGSAMGWIIAKAVGVITKIEQASRIELVDSLDGAANKVAWVFTRIFVSEFRVFTVASPTPLRALIETAIVFLLLVLLILKPKDGLTLNKTLNFILLIFLPILGASPNLIIRENQFEFRTLTSSYAMSLFLWIYSFQEISKKVSGRSHLVKFLSAQNKDNFTRLVCTTLVLFIVFHTQQDSKQLWIKPSLIRDNLTNSAIQKIRDDNTDSLCMVIPPTVYQPLNKLGIYSLKSDLVSSWVPEPYMRLKLEGLNLNSKRDIFIASDVSECETSSIVINYGSLGSSD